MNNTNEAERTGQVAQRTPLPWTPDVSKANPSLASVHSFGEIPEIHRPWNVAICTGPNAHANSEFIARACNSHAALVEALEALIGHAAHYACLPRVASSAHKDVAQARAALALAKGGQK